MRGPDNIFRRLFSRLADFRGENESVMEHGMSNRGACEAGETWMARARMLWPLAASLGGDGGGRRTHTGCMLYKFPNAFCREATRTSSGFVLSLLAQSSQSAHSATRRRVSLSRIRDCPSFRAPLSLLSQHAAERSAYGSPCVQSGSASPATRPLPWTRPASLPREGPHPVGFFLGCDFRFG